MSRAERRRQDKELQKAPALWKFGGPIVNHQCMMTIDICRPVTRGVALDVQHFEPTVWPPPQQPAPADQILQHPDSGKPVTRKFVFRVQALVDTGATASTIHQDISRMFQLPVIGRTSLEHANGTDPADVVAAGAILPETDGAHQPRIANLQLISSKLGRVRMLFGMDLLNGGVLTVDRIRQRWSWELKDPAFLRRIGLLSSAIKPTAGKALAAADGASQGA